MSIKPIDLQTNMAQMLEVGKGEQARTGAIAEQQHVMEKESDEKSKQINSKLDESKKAEKTVIMDQESKQEKGRGRYMHGRKGEKEKKDEARPGTDDRMGKYIDVLK